MFECVLCECVCVFYAGFISRPVMAGLYSYSHIHSFLLSSVMDEKERRAPQQHWATLAAVFEQKVVFVPHSRYQQITSWPAADTNTHSLTHSAQVNLN